MCMEHVCVYMPACAHACADVTVWVTHGEHSQRGITPWYVLVNPRRACAARVTVVVLCVCVCVCVFVCPGRSSVTHATKRQTRHTHGLSILLAPE